VAARIYGRLGLVFGPDLEQRLAAFVARNPKDKHGRHVYSAADFAQTPQEISRNFAHFG